jgi:pimeloyl-ACP methyl ester carboxylesterase
LWRALGVADWESIVTRRRYWGKVIATATRQGASGVRRAEVERGVRAVAVSAAGLATGVGALAAVNRLIAISAGELYSVLDGQEDQYRWGQHAVYYTVRGRGAPLLLVHGLYPGASSHEYRHVFASLARDFRVYALDLIGFGQSARPALAYTPDLYERLIQDFTREVMGGVDHPVSVVASGLGAAYAVRAAAERPHLFDRLVLVSPPRLEAPHGARARLGGQAARALLRLPLLGEGAYNVLVSRPALSRALGGVTGEDRRAYHARLDYRYLSAHQPGARYALASLFSGQLATPLAAVYRDLPQPVLLVWGRSDRRAPLEQVRAYRQANTTADIRLLAAGERPHEDTPEAFTRTVGAWLRASNATRLP